MELLKFIEQWYASQCNGDWEHQYGVSISNIDNPGWQVKVDLAETCMEGLEIDYTVWENSENDWYGFSVKDKAYVGVGDSGKLIVLLSKFRELVHSFEQAIPAASGDDT